MELLRKICENNTISDQTFMISIVFDLITLTVLITVINF